MSEAVAQAIQMMTTTMSSALTGAIRTADRFVEAYKERTGELKKKNEILGKLTEAGVIPVLLIPSDTKQEEKQT